VPSEISCFRVLFFVQNNFDEFVLSIRILFRLQLDRHLHQFGYLVIGHAASNNCPTDPLFVQNDDVGGILSTLPAQESRVCTLPSASAKDQSDAF
jgi:hypothetical protein